MTDRTLSTHFDEAAIDRIFAAIDQSQLPGGAVAIAIDGVPVYRKGFGRAHIELPLMLAPTMRMRIGSTTKHFACLAYLLLCEEGKAGIDDPIERHVPEINPVAHGVAMRQLMGHIGGLRDMFSVTLLTNGMATPVTDREMVAYCETIDDVDFAPGTAWSYNNGGYQLLTTAIERLSGQSLDVVLQERIFQPLGMNDTMLRRWERDFVPNSATLHMIDGRGGFTRDYMGMEISGMGGIVSTMDDMLLWLKHMDAPTIGSAETWALMRAPQRLTSGHSTGYGLGLMTAPYRGVETVHHAGTVMGGNSQMIKVPSAGLDISIAVNRADANAAVLANQIIDLLVEGLDPLPEKSEAVPVDGLYVSPTTGRVVELAAKEKVQLFSLDGATPLPVEIDGAGALRLPAVMSFLQTSFAPGPEVGRLVEFGNEDVLQKIEPNRNARIGDRAGAYRCDPIGAAAIVSDSGDGPRLEIAGRHGCTTFVLTPLAENIWRASGGGALSLVAGILTFADDGFDITFTRMKHVRFVRA